MREPRFWIMACFFFCVIITAYSYNLSAPSILQQLTGLNATKIGFLISGANLLGAVAMMANASHSDRVRERYLHIAIPFALAAVGFVVGGLSTQAWIGVPALSLVVVAYAATLGVHWTIPPVFLSGRSAAAGIAALNSIGMLGAFVGPYAMGIARDRTGNYQRGLLLCTIPCLIVIAIMLWMRRHTPAWN